MHKCSVWSHRNISMCQQGAVITSNLVVAIKTFRWKVLTLQCFLNSVILPWCMVSLTQWVCSMLQCVQKNWGPWWKTGSPSTGTKKLIDEVHNLPSLSHFQPKRHSLIKPHMMWRAAGSSVFEVNKTVTLARMISGRYRTDKLARFWSGNKSGYCIASTCTNVVGDLEHLLLKCPAHSTARQEMFLMWRKKSEPIPELQSFIDIVISEARYTEVMQFILDPVSIPFILCVMQAHGDEANQLIFHMTRTFAHKMHSCHQLLLRQ